MRCLSSSPNCSIVMVGKMWLGRNTSLRSRCLCDARLTFARESSTTAAAAAAICPVPPPELLCPAWDCASSRVVCGVFPCACFAANSTSAISVASNGCVSMALYTALWMRRSQAARSSSSASCASPAPPFCDSMAAQSAATRRPCLLASRCSIASNLPAICKGQQNSR